MFFICLLLCDVCVCDVWFSVWPLIVLNEWLNERMNEMDDVVVNTVNSSRQCDTNHYSFLTISVCSAVKITRFNVTSYHVLDNEQDAAPLILDCDYNVDPNERGFVLKWLLNGSRIFQWIPNQWPSYGSVSAVRATCDHRGVSINWKFHLRFRQ